MLSFLPFLSVPKYSKYMSSVFIIRIMLTWGLIMTSWNLVKVTGQPVEKMAVIGKKIIMIACAQVPEWGIG